MKYIDDFEPLVPIGNVFVQLLQLCENRIANVLSVLKCQKLTRTYLVTLEY